jgi:hypothetical protein
MGVFFILQTGTGFIKTENEYGKRFSLAPDSTSSCHASCKGNPATNDWVPADADMVHFITYNLQ